MSKAKQVREILAAGPLTFRELHKKIGGDDAQLKTCLRNLTFNGWITVGDDDDKTITLKSKRGGKAAPPQGKRKKSAGKTTIRRITARLQKRPADQFRNIILDNLIGAGALLRQEIEDSLDDLDGCFGLKQAIENQKRAEQIYTASLNA